MNMPSYFIRFVQTAWGRVKYVVFVPPSERRESSARTPRRKPTRAKRVAPRTRRLAGAMGK